MKTGQFCPIIWEVKSRLLEHLLEMKLLENIRFIIVYKNNKVLVISTITNVLNTYITEKIKNRFAELSEKTMGRTKARAVIGMTGIKKVIARVVRKDLYYASSEMDAKEWIVNNV